MAKRALLQSQLAAALSLHPSSVTRLKGQGMPTSSMEEAFLWRANQPRQAAPGSMPLSAWRRRGAELVALAEMARHGQLEHLVLPWLQGAMLATACCAHDAWRLPAWLWARLVGEDALDRLRTASEASTAPPEAPTPEHGLESQPVRPAVDDDRDWLVQPTPGEAVFLLACGALVASRRPGRPRIGVHSAGSNRPAGWVNADEFAELELQGLLQQHLGAMAAVRDIKPGRQIPDPPVDDCSAGTPAERYQAPLLFG